MKYWRDVTCEVCSLSFEAPFWVLWFKSPGEICVSQFCRSQQEGR